MKFEVVIKKRDEGVFNVAVLGALDTSTYEKFEHEVGLIQTQGTKAIVLNMESVAYISSLGIGSVFKLAQWLRGNGGTLLITNLQPQIKKVFDTVKAMPDSVFTSVAEADEYLNAIQKKELEKDDI